MTAIESRRERTVPSTRTACNICTGRKILRFVSGRCFAKTIRNVLWRTASLATDNSIGRYTHQGPGEPARARNKRPFEAARLEDLPDINTEKTEYELREHSYNAKSDAEYNGNSEATYQLPALSPQPVPTAPCRSHLCKGGCEAVRGARKGEGMEVDSARFPRHFIQPQENATATASRHTCRPEQP